MKTKYSLTLAAGVLSLLISVESAYANNKQYYFEGSRQLATQQYGEQAEFQPTYSNEEMNSFQRKVRRPTAKTVKKPKNAQLYVEQKEFDDAGYIASKSTGYRRKVLANRLFIDAAPIVNSGAVIGYERHVFNKFSVGPYAGMMKITKDDVENEIMFAGLRGRWFVMGDADQHGLYAMVAGQYTQVKGKISNIKLREKLGLFTYGVREETITPEVTEFGGMAGAGYQLPINVSNDYKMLLDLAGMYSHAYDVKNEARFQNGKEALPTTIQYQFFVNASVGLIF